jgi:NitT/TauT family transport system substrate-binding protein/putative hydroxymethylpyrimidine transport system substrate-binding protein
VLASLLAAAVLAGCGSAGHLRMVSLMLDFTPNAAHAGVYAALAHGYDRQAGIVLKVTPPPSPADSIKLLEAGRVDFSILDIHDLAIARERGAQLVGVMAIVERPLAAVIAQPGIRTPAALQGKTVGITGVPSDNAVLDSILQGAGGNPRRIKTITIGGNAVPDLLSGRVTAATAFWNDEGIALQRTRPGFHVFRVDRYGAPSYPELVLCTRRSTLRDDPGFVRAVVRALDRGDGFAISNPSAAAADLERQVPGLDSKLVAADLAALRPAFAGPDGRPGELDPGVLRAWSAWEVRFGLVSRRPDVAQAFAISR